VFSAGKPLVALAVALLEERGLLDVHAPIKEVIPEFGVRGKERITTLDVLTHRGGILMPEFVDTPEHWSDWDRVVDAICAVRPSLPRGTLAYHPLEYGWVLSEVVRRVAGRPLPEFLRDELLAPAGLATLRFGVSLEELPHIARAYWLGDHRERIGQVNIARLFERAFSLPSVMTAFVPGGGLVGDAGSLAALYDLLLAGGVARGGKRLIAERTVRTYTRRHVFGWCRSTRAPMGVGRGFLVGWRGPWLYGWWDNRSCFGHAGLYCTVAFADEAMGLSVAIVTNGNRGRVDIVRRFASICGALRGACRSPQRFHFFSRR
jgi:CubicO group peptidase (beta-lactamase class C family)